MRISQLTYPSTTIISLQEAKEHLRVSSDSEDALISDCIKSATDFVEKYTGITLMSGTYRAYLDAAEALSYDTIEIWKFPITAISSIQYVDSNGDTQSLSASYYSTDIIDSPTRIFCTVMPTQKINTFNTFMVNFTCGYANRDSIPFELIGWVKILTGFFYETRQSEYTGNTGNVTNEIKYSYQRALDKFRKDCIV